MAHALAKDLTEPLPTRPTLELAASWLGSDGTHPLWDRDEVHEIYAEWRQVFNEYDPPRTAVAEAWVHAARRARYASPEGLGQAFNFDLLQADLDAEQFREIIAGQPRRGRRSPARRRPGCCPTTTSSGTPPATACPARARDQDGKGWLLATARAAATLDASSACAGPARPRC